MFLTRDKPQQGRFFTGGYGTAGTTTTTTLASQGGLLINIDSATGDIPQTASGWIEDEKYGFYGVEFATSTSIEFKTGVISGHKVLRMNLLDATARARANLIPASNYSTVATNFANSAKLPPIKPSTKYKFKMKGRMVLASGSGPIVGLDFVQLTSTGTATTAISSIGTTASEFTYFERTFTSAVDGAFLGILLNTGSAGGVGYVDFDINSMTLEEVIEPVANSLVTPSPSLVSFTAVGSTDNIDTSLDPTFVAVNTYTPPVAISETATNKQTFVPTKSKLTRIGIYPVAKGTGNWTVTVHDASNVVQAVITIANASLTNGVVNYFNVPANVTALASYHFHVTSTVADGTVRVGTAADLETCSYIQNYYKPTTNFKASQNNLSVSVPADEDGFIEGSVLNVTTGAWSFNDTVNDGSINNNMYFYRTPGVTFDSNLVKFSGAAQEYRLKINLGLVATTDLIYTIGFIANNTISYSFDDISYTPLGTLVGAGGNFSIPMTGQTIVYIKNYANAAGSMTAHSASCSVNTSSINGKLKNYPTNKDIIKQYATTLSGATTSATYRATKWGFPAIEYSATEYQFLDVDTTATGSTVAFSELGTTYTTVADGASLAISSTSTPNLFVKANITANRLYSSSNDFNASSDKDGSLKQTITYQVVQ